MGYPIRPTVGVPKSARVRSGFPRHIDLKRTVIFFTKKYYTQKKDILLLYIGYHNTPEIKYYSS